MERRSTPDADTQSGSCPLEGHTPQLDPYGGEDPPEWAVPGHARGDQEGYLVGVGESAAESRFGRIGPQASDDGNMDPDWQGGNLMAGMQRGDQDMQGGDEDMASESSDGTVKKRHVRQDLEQILNQVDIIGTGTTSDAGSDETAAMSSSMVLGSKQDIPDFEDRMILSQVGSGWQGEGKLYLNRLDNLAERYRSHRAPSIGSRATNSSSVSTYTVGYGLAAGCYVDTVPSPSRPMSLTGLDWDRLEDGGGRLMAAKGDNRETEEDDKRRTGVILTNCFRCKSLHKTGEPRSWINAYKREDPIESMKKAVRLMQLDMAGAGEAADEEDIHLSDGGSLSSEELVTDEEVESRYRPVCDDCLPILENGEDDAFRIAKQQDKDKERENRRPDFHTILEYMGTVCDAEGCKNVGFPRQLPPDEDGEGKTDFPYTTCDWHWSKITAIKDGGSRPEVRFRKSTNELFEEIEESIDQDLDFFERLDEMLKHERWKEYFERKCPGTSFHGHACMEDKLPGSQFGPLCEAFLKERKEPDSRWMCEEVDENNVPCRQSSATWMGEKSLLGNGNMPMCEAHEKMTSETKSCLSCGRSPGRYKTRSRDYDSPTTYVKVNPISYVTGGHCQWCFKVSELVRADPDFYTRYKEAFSAHEKVRRGMPWVAVQRQVDLNEGERVVRREESEE